jgi:hypothetical protein
MTNSTWRTFMTTGTIDIGIGENYLAPQPAAAPRGTFGSAIAHSAAQAARPDMWHSTVVLKNHKGMEEAFSIGPDGYVWHYLVGRYADSGSRLFSTGLAASVFNISRLPDGRRVAIGADGLNLNCICETAPGSGRWSEPRKVPFNTLRGTLSIDKIMMQTRGAQLLVGVVTERASEMGYRLLELWDGIWADDQPVFCKSPTRARSTGQSVWQKLIAQEMPDVVRDGPVYRRIESGGGASFHPVPQAIYA